MINFWTSRDLTSTTFESNASNLNVPCIVFVVSSNFLFLALPNTRNQRQDMFAFLVFWTKEPVLVSPLYQTICYQNDAYPLRSELFESMPMVWRKYDVSFAGWIPSVCFLTIDWSWNLHWPPWLVACKYAYRKWESRQIALRSTNWSRSI